MLDSPGDRRKIGTGSCALLLISFPDSLQLTRPLCNLSPYTLLCVFVFDSVLGATCSSRNAYLTFGYAGPGSAHMRCLDALFAACKIRVALPLQVRAQPERSELLTRGADRSQCACGKQANHARSHSHLHLGQDDGTAASIQHPGSPRHLSTGEMPKRWSLNSSRMRCLSKSSQRSAVAILTSNTPAWRGCQPGRNQSLPRFPLDTQRS
jgi:hypothetical protein